MPIGRRAPINQSAIIFCVNPWFLTIPHPASRRARIKGIGVSEAYDYDLVCIGSGPAGQRAAVQAAKLGKRAAVLERERVVGGVCLHTGTIPSKTFREAVIGLTNR